MQFPQSSSIGDPSKARLREFSHRDQADASGSVSSIPESFEKLRLELNDQTFRGSLGKFLVDDPSKLDRLALANLGENEHARSHLASLTSARSCLYGSLDLGVKRLFSKKSGIASRFKT